jgi:integrase
LGRISDEDCSRFVSSLAALPGRRGERLAANTIRKHCIEIEGLWRFAGPRTKRCRHALDLFRDDRGLMPMPWLDPPAAEENEDEARWFSVEEIRAIIDACSVATKPVDGLIPPWLWWQSLIRVAYYTGLRIGSLLSLEYGWILRSGDSLIVPASAMKKRRAHRQHLHPAAAESIDLIKTPGRVRIFQWPHTSRSLYRHLDRILAAAGLGADRHPPKFHGLRRTHGDSLGDLDAVEQSLGHRTRAQAAQYTRRRSKAAAAIDRLPDVGGHSRLPGQRLLF